MTRMSLLSILLLSLLASRSPASSLPGQDINAYTHVDYCVQVQTSACADASYTDASNNAMQSQSLPATATLEATVGVSIAGPAKSFVAPNDSAPVYNTLTSSFYWGPSLIGQLVKVAGKLAIYDGYYCIDDSATLALPIPSLPAGTAQVLATIPLCNDLITWLPPVGSNVIAEGVVRLGGDNQPWLLPLSNAAITIQQ